MTPRSRDPSSAYDRQVTPTRVPFEWRRLEQHCRGRHSPPAAWLEQASRAAPRQNGNRHSTARTRGRYQTSTRPANVRWERFCAVDSDRVQSRKAEPRPCTPSREITRPRILRGAVGNGDTTGSNRSARRGSDTATVAPQPRPTAAGLPKMTPEIGVSEERAHLGGPPTSRRGGVVKKWQLVQITRDPPESAEIVRDVVDLRTATRQGHAGGSASGMSKWVVF